MGYVDFSNLTHLILDEADRMLDMGFAPAIMNIVHKLPRDRQTLLFSATMPSEIRRFAKQILRSDPAEINIAISKPAENIMQVVYEVADHGKIPLTQHLLEGKENLDRVIIFASTKKKVRDLAAGLKRVGLNVGEMHSDLNQTDREKSLQAFRNGNLKIVVATDVLSRGIDIKGIDLVINYDCPSDAEDYVHRIGRTARADASGIAITYVNGADRRRLRQIEELIETSIRRLPLPPDLKDAVPGKGRSEGGYRGKGGGKRGGNRRPGGHSKRRPPKKN
jgi:ATP-dependent RNA helicase RhlE